MTAPRGPLVHSIASIARRLQASEAVIIPTDTLPGLAVLPQNAETIWTLKQRPADKPLILMGATVDALLEGVDSRCHNDAKTLAAKHWPGAITLVLPARGPYVDYLNPGGSNIGCRIPACAVTQNLLSFSGPLATSSANPSGQSAATTALEAAEFFPDLAQLGPQPWPRHSGEASTVLIWSSVGCWRIARHGAVMPEGINAAE